ncbi:MAG: transcription elongation factor GreA [Chloroflexi bacterium]|nr:transcription elongation factor GreA [Chloroflexota bacterium]
MATPEQLTVNEAVAAFVAARPAEEQAQLQQELLRFGRWFGSSRALRDLTPGVLTTYQEQLDAIRTDRSRALPPLKAFLVEAERQGWLARKLSSHVRIRPRNERQQAPTRRRNRDVQLVHLTREGHEALKAELEHLITVVRPQVAQALMEARADRDIRENAPYDAAKDHQAQIEARIRELEQILTSVQILEQPQTSSKAVIGSTVTLFDLAEGERLRYTLVGTHEASPREGKISVESPVGRALLDRSAGETVEVEAPGGTIHYRIEGIEA